MNKRLEQTPEPVEEPVEEVVEEVEVDDSERPTLDPLPDLEGISQDLGILIGGGLPMYHAWGSNDLEIGNGAVFMTECPECNQFLIDYLNSQESEIRSSLGDAAWTELAPLYTGYSDGWALYVDYRKAIQIDSPHTTGLCVGSSNNGKGVNCWTREWSVDDQRYTNPRAYYFKAVVIDKSRTSPDITEEQSINCGSGDPMLNCWSLEEPRQIAGGAAYWFPAYRLMPKIPGEDAEVDEILGDVRWEIDDQASLVTFQKDDAGVKWTIQGTVNLMGATFSLMGGVAGAFLAIGATLL